MYKGVSIIGERGAREKEADIVSIVLDENDRLEQILILHLDLLKVDVVLSISWTCSARRERKWISVGREMEERKGVGEHLEEKR